MLRIKVIQKSNSIDLQKDVQGFIWGIDQQNLEVVSIQVVPKGQSLVAVILYTEKEKKS